jgi:hypothetical protein
MFTASQGSSSGGAFTGAAIILLYVGLPVLLFRLWRPAMRRIWIRFKRLPSRSIPLSNDGWFDKRRSCLIYRDRQSLLSGLAAIKTGHPPPRGKLWLTPSGAPIVLSNGTYSQVSRTQAFEVLMSGSWRARRAARKAFPEVYELWRVHER